jgi:multidrug efflux system membrane fusion protein
MNPIAHPRLLLAPLAALLLATGLLSLSGCGEEQKAQAAAAPQGQPPGTPVSVAAVITRAVQQEREFSGQIEAMERAQLRPRVSGYIDSVRFQPGSLVKKGEVLFVIDPRPYQAEVARQEAAAASSRVKAELAASELQRAKRLLADNAIAQREHDERAATASSMPPPAPIRPPCRPPGSTWNGPACARPSVAAWARPKSPPATWSMATRC